MRYLILSDIHANFTALEAGLAVTWVTRWGIGANSHQRTDFIKVLSIRIRGPTVVSVCTAKPRRNFLHW